MNRMRIILLLFFLSIVSWSTAWPRSFTPWNSSINTGDEIYSGHTHNRNNTGRVTNGFQGGAYILIRMFQVFISSQDGPNCRHTPTCSAYGKEAVAKHGALIGSFMAGERLLRCNPFHAPEYDPVPDRLFSK